MPEETLKVQRRDGRPAIVLRVKTSDARMVERLRELLEQASGPTEIVVPVPGPSDPQ